MILLIDSNLTKIRFYSGFLIIKNNSKGLEGVKWNHMVPQFAVLQIKLGFKREKTDLFLWRLLNFQFSRKNIGLGSGHRQN